MPFSIEPWRRRITARLTRAMFGAGGARSGTEGIPRADIRRILVVRPNHRLGNLLLLTPLMAELERLFPGAQVDIVLAGEHGAELFRGYANVGRIYALSRRIVRHPVATIGTIMQLRRTRYDLAIDPCDASQSSRLLAVLARPRYKILHSPAGDGQAGKSGQPPLHMAQWTVHLVRAAVDLPSSGKVPGFPVLDLRLSDGERRAARNRLDHVLGADATAAPPSTVVGLFAEATGAKRYDAAWWQEVIRELGVHHPECAIVEIAPPDGRARLPTHFPPLSSPSPREVGAIISNMTCFVSADCGVMHLASASGTPTLGLFSASDAEKYAPYGHGSRAIATTGKPPGEVARLAGEWLTGLAGYRSADAAARSARTQDESPSHERRA